MVSGLWVSETEFNTSSFCKDLPSYPPKWPCKYVDLLPITKGTSNPFPETDKYARAPFLHSPKDNWEPFSTFIGSHLGICSPSRLAVKSAPVKAITTGEGGAILSNIKKIDKKAKLLRSHGIERKNKTFWKYEVNSLGYNFRLSDINCALGINQLKKLDKFISKRKKIASIYNNFFKNDTKFQISENIKINENSYHLYPLLLNLKNIKKTKDKIIREFLKNKIKLQVHYIPVNSQPYYKKKYKLDKRKFKNSFKFYEGIISLPIYYGLSDKEIKYILKISNKIFNMKK